MDGEIKKHAAYPHITSTFDTQFTIRASSIQGLLNAIIYASIYALLYIILSLHHRSSINLETRVHVILRNHQRLLYYYSTIHCFFRYVNFFNFYLFIDMVFFFFLYYFFNIILRESLGEVRFINNILSLIQYVCIKHICLVFYRFLFYFYILYCYYFKYVCMYICIYVATRIFIHTKYNLIFISFISPM